MSLNHSPKIVTNGLVFCYDQSNIQKSWKGAPATNLFTEANLNNWSKSATVSTSNYRTPFDTASYIITDDDTANWESISRSVTVPADSSSYTLSCMIRKTTGGTSARLGFNISFTGGTAIYFNPRFNSDTGVSNTGTVIDYGDWWYWYFTGTNNGTNTTFGCSFYPATGVYDGSDNSAAVGTTIMGAMMLASGSTAVRFADGTRSNTQSLLDIVNKKTITASSLTYASNGSFSFNGSSNYILLPAQYDAQSPLTGFGSFTGADTNSFSIELWLKTSQVAGSASYNAPCLVGRNDSDIYANLNLYNGYVYYAHYNSAWLDNLKSTTMVADNVWHQVVYVNNSDETGSIYIDGELEVTSSSSISGTNYFSPDNIGRGYSSQYFSGSIDSVKFYDKSLTAEEILQNFNALRGRYGV